MKPTVRKFIRKVSYDYLQRSSLEERREKGFLGDIVGYLYPFSLGDPLISHLEISGYSFISWVFYIPSGSSISYFHRDLPSFLFHRDLPSFFFIIRDLPIIVREHPSVP